MNIKKEFMEAEEAPEEEEEEATEEPAEEPMEETEEEPMEEPEEETQEEPALEPEEEEMGSMPVDGSSLTMSSPDGDIIDSCTLKSGKKLVISN